MKSEAETQIPMREEVLRSGATPEQAMEATISVARQQFGERLRSVYAIGSLGYGGYSLGWSDADIDLIVVDGLESADTLLAEGFSIRDVVHKLGFPEVDVKCYSIAILNSPATKYEYGIANRAVMILDSARLIYGEDVREEVRRPEKSVLREEALAVATGLLAKSDLWWAARPIDDTAALLALPGRLIVTCESGQVIGKVMALEKLLQDYSNSMPTQVWPWVVWALAVRSVSQSRDLPEPAITAAQQAARELLAWVVPRL